MDGFTEREHLEKYLGVFLIGTSGRVANVLMTSSLVVRLDFNPIRDLKKNKYYLSMHGKQHPKL